jgi:hypothetical protein
MSETWRYPGMISTTITCILRPITRISASLFPSRQTGKGLNHQFLNAITKITRYNQRWVRPGLSNQTKQSMLSSDPPNYGMFLPLLGGVCSRSGTNARKTGTLMRVQCGDAPHFCRIK